MELTEEYFCKTCGHLKFHHYGEREIKILWFKTTAVVEIPCIEPIKENGKYKGVCGCTECK